MSDPVDEVRLNVGAILAQVKPPLEIYGLSESAQRLVQVQEEGRSEPVILNPGDATLTSPQLILLVMLHGTLSSELQSSFGAILLELISVDNVRVAVPAIVETGYVDQLCTALDMPPRVNDGAYLLATLMWSGTRIAMSRRLVRFSSADIARLERAYAANKNIRSHDGYVHGRDFSAELDRVNAMLQLARYRRISGELLEANPEINSDQHVLVTRMMELGFREDIVKSIQRLDRKVHEAGDMLDFAECMRLARTIFEEVVEDAGRRAASLSGDSKLLTDGAKGNFRSWKDVLTKTAALNGGESTLFQALYDYFSNTGTHRLASKREQARITRNMVIECGLLVVGRIQTLGKRG